MRFGSKRDLNNSNFSNYKLNQENEAKVLEFWENNKVWEKLKELRKNAPVFSFFEGPPGANNVPGVHHMRGRVYKDLFLRYKSMQGYCERRQSGWDCQGLPVELQVQKELGFKSKDDVLKFGEEKFVEVCRKTALKYAGVWTKQSKEFGMWMDWDKAYYTMDDDYREVKWMFLKECHKKGLFYKGFKVVPWCPKCRTSLSQLEVNDGYALVKDESVYVRFKSSDGNYFLVWTTTPWSLLGNTGLAVNPKLQYVLAEHKGTNYYLAKALLNKLRRKFGSFKVKKELLGKELAGLEYSFELGEKKFKGKVVPASFVTSDEGTGFVHLAPAHGEEDMQAGLDNNLECKCVVDECGLMTNAGKYEDLFFSKASKEVMKDLEKTKQLIYKELFEHKYPFCWRCKTPLVYRTSEEWFLKVKPLQELMLKSNDAVRWHPYSNYLKMKNWLLGLKDWNVSRRMYWGTALPVWECKNGHYVVVGSRAELKKLSGKTVKSLNKPSCDKVTFKCKKCGNTMKRWPQVLDVWLDSGVMPFATMNYNDKKYFYKWFPADLVVEMTEQVRLWFYTLLYCSVVLEKKAPYKEVLGYGVVLDAEGKKMSKSKGNTVWVDEVLRELGADVTRWLYLKTTPWLPLKFGLKLGKEVRAALNVLLNLGLLVKTYTAPGKCNELSKIDVWLLSRLEHVKREVKKLLDNYKPGKASSKLEQFFLEDLSRWYVRLVRNELKNKDSSAAYTLRKVYLELLKLMAPFTPFLTEAMYQLNYRNECKALSVHLLDWPSTSKGVLNKKLEEEMDLVRELTSLGLKERNDKRLNLRWPLSSARVRTPKLLSNWGLELLKKSLNVKKVRQEKGEPNVKLNTKVNEELKSEALLTEFLRNLQARRKELGLKVLEYAKVECNPQGRLKEFLEHKKEDILKASNTELVFTRTKEKQVILKVFNEKFTLYF